MKHTFKTLVQFTLPRIIILTAILTAAMGTSYLYAQWAGPQANPPGQNVDAPLNVGSVSQIKQAGLSLLSLIVNGKVQIQDGTQGKGKVLLSDANGIAGWVSTSSLGIGGGSGTSLPPCAVGQILQYDGVSWQCAAPPSGGTGLPSCSAGQIAEYNGISWQCIATPSGGSGGGISQLSSGTGIVLSPNPITSSGTISIDPAYTQRRISDACGSNQAIASVNSDGTVNCISVPQNAPCTYSGRVYSTNAICWLGSTNCAAKQQCNSNGTWKQLSTGFCDNSPVPQC